MRGFGSAPTLPYASQQSAHSPMRPNRVNRGPLKLVDLPVRTSAWRMPSRFRKAPTATQPNCNWKRRIKEDTVGGSVNLACGRQRHWRRPDASAPECPTERLHSPGDFDSSWSSMAGANQPNPKPRRCSRERYSGDIISEILLSVRFISFRYLRPL